MVDDNDFALDGLARLLPFWSLPPRVMVDSLTGAAGARGAVILSRHFVGWWLSGLVAG